MSFRYADFVIERTSPSRITLSQVVGERTKANGRPYLRTIGKYPGYASALAEVLSRLAERGEDIEEVEAHWQSFSQHLQNLYERASQLEECGVE